MEVYADNLYSALLKNDAPLNLRHYRPATRFSKENHAGKWAMRFARYVEYPAQVKRFNADIYHITEHGYAHLIRNLPAHKTIITVHDLIPFLKHRGAIKGVTPQKNPRLAEYSLKQLHKAAHLIAISENTKRDLITHCGCKAENISVIYYGLPDLSQIENLTKIKAREQLNLPDDDAKLILITGQDFYKNLETSVKVYNQLKLRHNIRLAHLGKNNSVWKQAKAFANDPGSVIEIPNITHEQIPTLYLAMDCVLFPSWYEGFGLPPIEAMACGTPAVTSNAASLPEAVGANALMANPDDVSALSTAIESVLYDENLRNNQIHLGLKHAKKFNWDRCAQQTAQVYLHVFTNQK